MILSSEINTKNVFGIVCHHAEKGCKPHPENSTGTARYDCCGNACDVAYTDRCCKRGAECLELRDRRTVTGVADNVLIKQTAYGPLHPVTDVRHLENLGKAGHHDARSNEQPDARLSPYECVNLVVDGCKCFPEPHK